MQEQTIRDYQLYLHTSQADTQNVPNTDVTWTLNNPIRLTSQQNRFKARIISATIPYAFSQVNETNNIIAVQSTSGNFNITIPQGNYNITDLATVVCNLIKSYILLNFAVVITMNFGYNQSNSLLTFTLPVAPAGYNITIPYTTLSAQLMEMLGFTSQIVITPTTSAVGNQPVNVNPAMEIQVRSRTLNQASSMEAIYTASATSNILGNIPISGNQWSYIQFYQPLNYWSEIVNRVIDNINIYMTTAEGIMKGQFLPSLFCIEIVEVGSQRAEVPLRQTGLMSEDQKEELVKLEEQKSALISSLDNKLSLAKEKLKNKLVLTTQVEDEDATKERNY